MKLSFVSTGFFLFFSLLFAPDLSANILAYEGFATDVAGSGTNYTQGSNLEGVSETRTGFQNAWFNEVNQTAARNVRAEAGNLTYSGYLSGDAGLAVPFNNDAVQSSSSLGRSFDVSDASVSGGYFLSLLIDYAGGEGGFTLTGAAGSNVFVRNGSNITWSPAGGSATGGFTNTAASLGISDAGPNLVVVQYTADNAGAPSSFYSRWNLWVNPDLSGGTLGPEDFSGWGIGLYDGGVVTAPSAFGISNARINNGSSIQIDEVYLTNNSQSFMTIPEPGSFLLVLAGFAALRIFRRRR